MADTSALITIKDIVKEALWQGKKGQTFYTRYFQYLLNGYRELRLFTVEEGIKTVRLTVNTDIYTISMPSDCIEVVKVAVPIKGELWTLTNEEKMLTTTTESAGSETLDSTYGEGEDLVKYKSGYAGVGGVNVEGYYKIDYQKRRVKLANVDTTWLVMQYKSSGVSLSETTYIPVQYKEALKIYLWWQDALCENPNMAEYYRKLYRDALDKLQYLTVPTAEEFLDILRKSYSPLPQR